MSQYIMKLIVLLWTCDKAKPLNFPDLQLNQPFLGYNFAWNPKPCYNITIKIETIDMIKQRQQLIEMHLCFCKTSKFYWMLSISFILIEEIFLICSVFLQSESCNSVVIYEKYQTGYRKRYLFVFVILRSIVSIQHCKPIMRSGGLNFQKMSALYCFQHVLKLLLGFRPDS